MDTKVDASGGRELVDKLANIRETGSEEVSLKKAREALKDSLINYVGTDRSTTRPLDMVNLKLAELEGKKKELFKEKEKIFEAEEKLRKLSEQKNRYEKKEKFLTLQERSLNLGKTLKK